MIPEKSTVFLGEFTHQANLLIDTLPVTSDRGTRDPSLIIGTLDQPMLEVIDDQIVISIVIRPTYPDSPTIPHTKLLEARGFINERANNVIVFPRGGAVHDAHDSPGENPIVNAAV